MKIFIVEDEASIRKELSILLQKYGYSIESSTDFARITEHIREAGPDLVLLDINLPYQDGYMICREIRKQSDIPIIVLTSRNTDFDELMSLHTGADDFISKPYNAQVLIARIQKLLKRTYEAQANSVLIHKGVTLNLLSATAACKDQEVDLTKNELGILRLLMANKGNVIPRDAIIDELWQSDEFIDENTLNVNIVRLRKKLSEIGAPDFLYRRVSDSRCPFRIVRCGCCFAVLSVICIVSSGVIFQHYGILPSREHSWFQAAVILLAIGTVLFFFSISSVLLTAIQGHKNLYLKGLNAFLSRQIGSKIQTDF